MALAKLVRENRKKKKWSVQQLADKIDKSTTYISRIEVKGEIPSPDVIIKLAEVCGIKTEDLIEAAKADKSDQLKQGVDRKYDEAFELYRKERKKTK